MPRIDALQKYRNQLLSAFDAEQLQYLKYDNWTGLLTETDRLYATMFHDWDVLQKDCSDLAEAVQTLEWTVAPYVADGAEADRKAQEVAKVVTDALWKRTPRKPGTYSHTFTQLLGALVHGLFRGYNVHEIEWVNDGDMVYPAAFHQLPPQFMQWETRAGQVDRLLFVADGETDEPKPFPEHKFIVALNTSGPDHPLFNASYYSLIAWYGAYKFGLGWFMEYCQKYGMPKLVFHYESDRDRQQLEADLAEERVLNNILLKGDRAVDIANAPASGASLPQRELLNIAESQCHKLILGQTLTSDTSEHGGSLAQAKVHAGVQADIVKKRADFVADVLNSQLIPAIVLLNYGTLDVPMPELRYKIPQEGVTLERVQVVKTALEIQGMKLKKSEVYEFTGFAQPAEGDDVFESANVGGDMGGLAGLLGKGKPQGDTDPDKPKKKAPAKAGEDAEPVSAAHAEEVDAANPYGCNQYGEGWKSPHNGRASKPGAAVKKGDEEKKEPSLQELQAEIDSLKKQVQEGKIKSPAPGSPEYEELKKDSLESRDAYYKLNQRKEEIEKEIESIKRNEKAYKDAGQDADYNSRISTMENALKKVNAEMEANRRNVMKKTIDVFKKVNSDVATTSRAEAPTDPAQEWLAPIKAKFLEARKAGASMADLKQMLLTMHPDTKALAKAFANNILAGFAGESEEVDAANPYGCNQYGEGWVRPHNGMQTMRRRKDATPAPDTSEIDKIKIDDNDDSPEAMEKRKRKIDLHKQFAEEMQKRLQEWFNRRGESVKAAAGTEDDKRPFPVQMPDGSMCHTYGCERHKGADEIAIKEAEKKLDELMKQAMEAYEKGQMTKVEKIMDEHNSWRSYAEKVMTFFGLKNNKSEFSQEIEDIYKELINNAEYDKLMKDKPVKPSAEEVNALYPSKEIIKRYRNGTLTPDDIAQIERHKKAHEEYYRALEQYEIDIIQWNEDVKELGLKIVELAPDKRGSTKFKFLNKWNRAKKEKVQASLDDLMRITSKEIAPETIEITGTRKQRSYHLDGTVYLSKDFRGDSPAHEAVHALERLVPDLNERSIDFLVRRAGNEEPQPLYELTGNSAYGFNEYAFKDSFVERGNKAYCGKVYASEEQESFETKKQRESFMNLSSEGKKQRIRTTDLLTMGVERVINDAAKFAREDPDYFKFVITTLRK